MFGLGFWEVVIIVVVLIIALKPEDIPHFFRKVGKIYKEIADFNAQICKMIKDMDTVIEDTETSSEKDSDRDLEEDHGSTLTKTLKEKDN